MIPKVYRLFKPNRSSADRNNQFSYNLSKSNALGSTNSEKGMEKRNIAFAGLQQLNGHSFIDDADDDPPIKSSDSRPAPHWLDGPRDSTTLPDIIASTYSDYSDEADYAMKQMLAILETLNPIEEFMELFENALKAIQYRLPFDIILNHEKKPDWKAIRLKLNKESITLNPQPEYRGLTTGQMSAVFDAIPFLFDAVACNGDLNEYQNVLSMIVLIAMTGNSMIRRQSINAVQALMERNMLSQEFMCDGVVPGLFHIFQSGVGAYQSTDLRMECVQALCQVISYDTIHDRRWLFNNYLPLFSLMLKDATMHVRQSALHIFGNLGNMFGQKFTEVFLVPHLITLSCDMTWAVRKVACEIFVKVADCASSQVRADILSPNFVRLLNDPNKWVSFIAYQQLGPFIALFANPEITGLDLKNGQVVVRDTLDHVTDSEVSSTSFSSDADTEEFGVLPPNTWLPDVDRNEEFDLRLTETTVDQVQKEASTAIVKTPKRGERVMDSVLSGINKMFSPFERSSPKSKEVEKIAATFSSPSKRSPLSLHSAVSLMDKWSKRNNPNNPQRFPVFDSSNSEPSLDLNFADRRLDQNCGTGIAAKCNSTDDLTKLGLEDDDMQNSGPKYVNDEDSTNGSDSDEDSEFEKSFITDEPAEEKAEVTPLKSEINSSSSESESVSAANIHIGMQEPLSNEFSLTYWSSNYAITAIEDELKPFGTSSSLTNSPTSNSYLESRFDVMKTNNMVLKSRSQPFGPSGPLNSSTSPRRETTIASESSSPAATVDSSESDDSTVILNTEEKELLGILDIDEMNMSISSDSSIHGEAAMTEESDISLTSAEQAAFQHVPTDLVESYMKVMGPASLAGGSIATGDASLCAEIYRHCAHNFPAICYTLGRAAWPRLRLVFRKLALDEQARVRQSISHSIHEIANMLGQEITDEDLLPVFHDLRNDQNSDVRNGILVHLYDFVKCLSPEKRNEIIFFLPQFFPIGAQPGNQAQNGDWRSRFELISQLSKLCSLYNIQDVNLHMSGIALTLADDRVAEVRLEAVMLVSTIVGALVFVEWEAIKACKDIENCYMDIKNKKEKNVNFLSEQFVDDIVSSFAKTQKWTRRQTFCFICAQILRDKQCDGIQFRYFFAGPLQQLVQDKVPNVRLASCEAMCVWRKTLIAARAEERRPLSPLSSPGSEPSPFRRDINFVSDMMVRLSNDSDIDAAFLAQKYQGLTDDQQPVDVVGRTIRMRKREEQFFGDLILTDSTGCMVRVVGKEIKQLIKSGTAQPEANKAPVEQFGKEAPIEKMEVFDDDKMLSQPESTNISTPPEVVATIQQLPELNAEDDTDGVVDMEIEEDETTASSVNSESSSSQDRTGSIETTREAVIKKSEEEIDIPMDPAPSTSVAIADNSTSVTSPIDSDA